LALVHSPTFALWTTVDYQQEYGEGEAFGCHQPAWILNMEAELKKEWQKETAKLKKGVKEVPKGIIKTKKEAPKGIIKRKQEAPRGIIKRKQEAPKGIIKKKKDTKVSKISNNSVNVTGKILLLW
jgi:hypothetical protein